MSFPLLISPLSRPNHPSLSHSGNQATRDLTLSTTCILLMCVHVLGRVFTCLSSEGGGRMLSPPPSSSLPMFTIELQRWNFLIMKKASVCYIYPLSLTWFPIVLSSSSSFCFLLFFSPFFSTSSSSSLLFPLPFFPLPPLLPPSLSQSQWEYQKLPPVFNGCSGDRREWEPLHWQPHSWKCRGDSTECTRLVLVYEFLN